MISWRALDQTGYRPPVSEETFHLPPELGNGWTKTSGRPDSPAEYATQRPSGENAASNSGHGLAASTSGWPAFHPVAESPSIGRIIKSGLVWNSAYARNLPLGCHAVGV